MIKLIIVDDERTTRESLASYIPWRDLKIDSVRSARNGAQALGLAEEDPPDILLTDVRMPKMDGLALANRIRELYPECQIVFLSGYADKGYLKQAIHLQAVDYVEKPVDPEELREAIRSAVSRHEGQAQEKREASRAREIYRENVLILREELVRELVGGHAPIGTLRERFPEALPVGVFDGHLTAAALVLNWRRQLSKGEQESIRRALLSRLCESAPFGLPSSLLGFTENDVMAIVLGGRYFERSPHSVATLHGLASIAGELSQEAFSFSLGVGMPVLGLENLPRSYLAALRSAGLQFYRGAGQLLFSASIPRESFTAPAAMVTGFREALQGGDVEQAELLVGAMAEQARRQECVDIDGVRDVFFKLFLILFEVARSKSVADLFDDEAKSYIWQEIRDRTTLAELAQFVGNHVRAVFGSASQGGKGSRKVLEIQRYIRSHLGSDALSLQAIADHTCLSRTYVSALYKSCTGENIGDYITGLRIEKAKELLGDCRMKTYEVAARVGYQDVRYFSTLFKKHVGCTPTEYRDQC
jgi:two-component system response regulator YesN